MDFTAITDHLATGAAIGSEADVEQLVAWGATHVIDCRDDFNDAPLLAVHPAISYLWNGTPDDGQPKPVEWFRKSLAFALPALSFVPLQSAAAPTAPLHPHVYVHCAAGVNRGPSSAFAIMCALDWPYRTAEERIRQMRPQVGLRYKDDAVRALTALGY